MTNPFEKSQPPAKKDLFNPAMLIGIAVVAVLAIVVVIVAVTRDGDDNEAAPSSSSSASETSKESDATPTGEPEAGTVTNDDLGMAYDFPLTEEPFDELYWAGPTDVSYGELSLKSAVGYESCTAAAGVDLLYGMLESDESDLATAAKSMYETAADNVVTDAEDVSNGSATSVTLDSGLEGELYEGDVTRTGEDDCGNTTIHVVALAVQNDNLDTVIMLGSLRMDGDSVATGDELIDVTVEVLKSLRAA